MNLKSKSQKLSQAILVITLGLIICPKSAQAATSTLPTESLELSKPTLLVNSVKQVSMLVEASNTISSELSNDSLSVAVDNLENNTYTIAKEDKVTPLGEVATVAVELNVVKTTNLVPQNSAQLNVVKTANLVPQNSAQLNVAKTANLVPQNSAQLNVVKTANLVPQNSAQLNVVKTANLVPQNSGQTLNTPSLIASNEIPISTQASSLSIPVEIEFQPTVKIESQFPSPSISIPVEVENKTKVAPVVNSFSKVNNSINIPVVASSQEEIFVQQTETLPQETLSNVERPTLISNTSFNQNLDKNSRIINPTPKPQTNEEPPSPTIMSSVPIQVEYYNPMITPSAGEMVSPDLPQINSPEPYLPNNTRPFNGFIWPAKGVFTSGYGPRWGRMHKGIDIAAPVGTPIVAAAEGEVISAGWSSGGFGNLVKIQHSDGTVTLYAHNSKIHVRRGQFVNQGQHIANMGSTGFSTGPHLHFEIHPKGQKAVNPMAFLPRR